MLKKILYLKLLLITTIIYSQNTCPGISTVTYAGQIYNTVQIGNQCWLKENLNIGTEILTPGLQMNNGTIEKFCYGNIPFNCENYGGLYQWAEAVQYKKGATNTTSPNPAFTGNVQGICPSGWHIPSEAEFQTLIYAVNSDGNALKAIGQGVAQYGGGGTNTSGFSALLAGQYDFLSNGYNNLGGENYFWSSTEFRANAQLSYLMILSFEDSNVGFGLTNKYTGFSIRCLNDNSFTSVEGDNEKGLPANYSVSQNYPNPFNPTTTINYSVPKQSIVIIKVYNVLCKEVATLLNENKPAGNYSVQFNANKLVSGVYFYRMESGSYTESKKFVIIK